MQNMLENSRTSSESSVADVLSCISDPKVLLLFKAVVISDNDCSGILITKLGLTRRQFYSSMEKLMHIGVVRRIRGKHSVTSLGKVLFDCILKMEMSIKYYWKLKAIDSITTAAEAKGLPAKEYQMIVNNLIDNDEIKDVLVSNEVESTQSLLCRTVTST